MKKINPREIMQIARGLNHIEQDKRTCAGTQKMITSMRLADALNPCNYIYNRIIQEIAENPLCNVK